VDAIGKPGAWWRAVKIFCAGIYFPRDGNSGFSKNENFRKWQTPITIGVVLFALISQIILAEGILTRFN
jgi:hypothetical protein